MEYGNFIDGKWAPSESGRTFESLEPANGEVVGVVARSTAADVDRAVGSAVSAFKSWRLVPAPKRGEILFRVGQLLQARKEELASLMSREMGK
ncbi:MAG TPA: aldehyde dehydrogenase family protein, partial [Chloroflexota bacterium]